MDANAIQNQASDPRHSVWVGASAGTGKTKVLTDRVLRLLLEGYSPSRITCITYTKAAAKEMEERIQATLIRWVAMDEDALLASLTALMGQVPRPKHKERARHLFATVLDAPEGVRIQTIHSFCQSILKRFPLEAGISPHFTVLDDRGKDALFNEIHHAFLLADGAEYAPQVAAALATLRGIGDQFGAWMDYIIANRYDLTEAMGKAGVEALIARAYAYLGISPGEDAYTIASRLFPMDDGWAMRMREVADAMGIHGTPTLKDMASTMCKVLAFSPEQRRGQVEEWRKLWFTKEGPPRKIKGAMLEKNAPHILEMVKREQDSISAFCDALRALEVAKRTEQVLHLASALLQAYEQRKKREQVLDFDDILQKTDALLQQDGIAPWVLYKLDGGIDHLLIDEAQDTSPIQWRIVTRLVEEFFTGKGRSETHRTLFVVGDEKQSIYSFQGARPKGFAQMRDYFARRCKEAGAGFVKLPMTTSFRTVPAVLDVVDGTIRQPHIHQSISFEETPLPHYPHRKGQGGEVGLWQLPKPVRKSADNSIVLSAFPIKQEEEDAEDENGEDVQGDALQAAFIARKITHWLEKGEMLASRNRPVQPGDILVLVRNRNGMFIPRLIRELKQRHIPVGGADRLRLMEHIAVQDMLALADFLLLPEDDLQLAALLKSPLFGMGEEELFILCTKRGDKSLWRHMREMEHPFVAPLLALLNKVDMLRPYELFSHVLDAQGGRAKMAARLGHWVFEPLNELLMLAMQFERDHPPSLQGFLHFMRSADVEIKREMEQGGDFVRILTVHNAKGLQAPIVILPKTEKNPISQSGRRLHPLWAEGEGGALFFAGQSRKELPGILKAVEEANRKAQLEEEYRLLYVAMTRAEDRLYLAATGEGHTDSWVSAVREGGAAWWQEGQEEGMERSLVYTTEQEVAALPSPQAKSAGDMPEIPVYLRAVAPLEPYPSRPLSPSQFDDDLHGEGAMQSQRLFSPVEQALPLERGIYLHTMLQYLPATPDHAREHAGLRYLERHAGHIPETERQRWVAEVISVLRHPEFCHVFSGDALAEVPVAGVVELASGKKVVSGRIDRLKVADDGVYVVDFKTQRHAPKSLDAVPPAYVKQMALYAALLQRIYPGKPIHCALLWTAEPRLLPLPASLFAQILDVAVV